MDAKTAVQRITEQFPDIKQDDNAHVVEFRGETTLIVPRESLVAVCTFARDELEFNRLSDVAGIDYWPDEPRFAAAYQLHSLVHNTDLRIKAYAAGNEAKLPSVCGVWPGANWMEREIYDMFGVEFVGHPDPRRILLPYDWTGHPLRKDYPLGYEQVQFTFNFDKIDDQKPYAKE